MADTSTHKLFCEWDLTLTDEQNHHAAMTALAMRLGWNSAEFVAGIFKDDTYYTCDYGTRVALENLTAWCTGGGRYETKNPYSIGIIKTSLTVLGRLEGCAWLAANGRASQEYCEAANAT
jgi:hypothetical protein